MRSAVAAGVIVLVGCVGDPAIDGDATTEVDAGTDVGSSAGAGTSSSGQDSTSSSGGELGGDTTGDPDDPPGSDGPQLYPAGQVHSPITPWIADRWLDVAADHPERLEDVFMKVGASSTVSPNTLACFAGPDVDLDAHLDLDPTLQFLLGGEAAGTTPFDRTTLAAQAGVSAGWALTGDPSPLQAELDLLSPRLALVHYGTNDMQLGASYAGALAGFYVNLHAIVDATEQQGVIPVLFGITRRGDDPDAQHWVATFNAAIRGIAQQRQVPFVDLFEAIDPLPGAGLGPDGLHLAAAPRGACHLDPAGLQYGYNMRNLVALQALARAVGVLVEGGDAPDDPLPPRPGVGTLDDPIEVDTLPFADGRDTTVAGAPRIDAYPGCSDSDQSGPELWYRLSLAAPTRLRAIVLDDAGVDIDLHLLDASADPDAGCLARDDRIVQGTFGPGELWLVADTWGGTGVPLAGAYLLLVVECDPDDPGCA